MITASLSTLSNVYFCFLLELKKSLEEKAKIRKNLDDAILE